MVDAARGAASGLETGSGSQEKGSEDGQLVVILPRVVENADHVFGNLFQRIYHAIERYGEMDETVATDLRDSARELEECLQLLMDYVAPFPPSLQYLDSREVVESLARQVGDVIGDRLLLRDQAAIGTRVMVDPSRLGRAFSQLVLQLEKGSGTPRGESGRAAAVVEVSQDSLVVILCLPQSVIAPRTSKRELQWAVAEKLLELHGGGLRALASEPAGETRWEITLPIER